MLNAEKGRLGCGGACGILKSDTCGGAREVVDRSRRMARCQCWPEQRPTTSNLCIPLALSSNW
jgi:hypothetical protein